MSQSRKLRKKIEKKSRQPDNMKNNDIRDIARKEAQKTVKQTIKTEFSYRWEGPLAHPEDLKAYKEIDSSFPERLLKMAENEQSHRHGMDKEIIKKQFRHQSRGQLIGALCFAPLLIAGIISTFAGYATAGIAMILTASAPVLITLITGIAKTKKNKPY